MDLVAQRTPAVDRTIEPEPLDGLDRAVDGDPGHDLGVDEVPARPADLPDAFVRLAPRVLDVAQERELELPRVLVGLEPGLARLQQRVHQLAVDIELELPRGGVADADR